MATLVEGDLKAPFSIATTPRCRGGRYSIPWIAPLHPWSLPYSAKQGSIKSFESLVWLNLGLKPGLPGHWWTLYSLLRPHRGFKMVTNVHKEFYVKIFYLFMPHMHNLWIDNIACNVCVYLTPPLQDVTLGQFLIFKQNKACLNSDFSPLTVCLTEASEPSLS